MQQDFIGFTDVVKKGYYSTNTCISGYQVMASTMPNARDAGLKNFMLLVASLLVVEFKENCDEGFEKNKQGAEMTNNV